MVDISHVAGFAGESFRWDRHDKEAPFVSSVNKLTVQQTAGNKCLAHWICHYDDRDAEYWPRYLLSRLGISEDLGTQWGGKSSKPKVVGPKPKSKDEYRYETLGEGIESTTISKQGQVLYKATADTSVSDPDEKKKANVTVNLLDTLPIGVQRSSVPLYKAANLYVEERVHPNAVDQVLVIVLHPIFCEPALRALMIGYMKWMPLFTPTRWVRQPDEYCILRLAWMDDSKIVVPKHSAALTHSLKERADRMYVVQIELPNQDGGVPYYFPRFVRTGEELREIKACSCVHTTTDAFVYEEKKVVTCLPHLDTDESTDCGAGISYYRNDRAPPFRHWIPPASVVVCDLKDATRIRRLEQEVRKVSTNTISTVTDLTDDKESASVSMIREESISITVDSDRLPSTTTVPLPTTNLVSAVDQRPSTLVPLPNTHSTPVVDHKSDAMVEYLPLPLHVLVDIAQMPVPDRPIPSAPELVDLPIDLSAANSPPPPLVSPSSKNGKNDKSVVLL